MAREILRTEVVPNRGVVSAVNFLVQGVSLGSLELQTRIDQVKINKQRGETARFSLMRDSIIPVTYMIENKMKKGLDFGANPHKKVSLVKSVR